MDMASKLFTFTFTFTLSACRGLPRLAEACRDEKATEPCVAHCKVLTRKNQMTMAYHRRKVRICRVESRFKVLHCTSSQAKPHVGKSCIGRRSWCSYICPVQEERIVIFLARCVTTLSRTGMGVLGWFMHCNKADTLRCC